MVALLARFRLFRIVLVAFVLTPLALIALMFLPGAKGPNRFGADPNDQDLAETFR